MSNNNINDSNANYGLITQVGISESSKYDKRTMSDQIDKVQKNDLNHDNIEHLITDKQAAQDSLSIEEQDLNTAIEVIADFIRKPARDVNFSKYQDTGKTVIKVLDSSNNELIKQFPSDEILEIAQRIAQLRQDIDDKAGILFDEHV